MQKERDEAVCWSLAIHNMAYPSIICGYKEETIYTAAVLTQNSRQTQTGGLVTLIN